MQPREQVDTGVDVGSNETARTSADPGRPGRLRGRCLAARGLAAGLLVAGAGLLALPLPAQAQSKVLVSNVGQINQGHGSLLDFDQAQAFTTGSNIAGYTLKSVEIDIGTTNENATAFTVSVHSNSSGAPGASLGTLSNPASLSRDGVYAFTTRGIALAAATTYFVVIDRVGTVHPSDQLYINNTASDAQDPGRASGWSIGNGSLYRDWDSSGSWTPLTESKKIRVKWHQPRGQQRQHLDRGRKRRRERRPPPVRCHALASLAEHGEGRLRDYFGRHRHRRRRLSCSSHLHPRHSGGRQDRADGLRAH